MTNEVTTVAAPGLVPGFDETLFGEVNGGDSSAFVRGKREEAFQAYATIPMPQKTDAEWRRTDPGAFPFSRFRRLPDLMPLAVAPTGPWDDRFDVVVSVSDVGYAVLDRTRRLEKGDLVVTGLRDAAEKGKLRPEQLHAGRSKFLALNSAFWNLGLVINVADKVELEKGILIRYRHEAGGRIFLPRVVVVAGSESRFTLMELLSSAGDAEFMTVGAREFHLGAAAGVKIVTLQEWGESTYSITNDWAVLERDARIDWTTLNFGSRICKSHFGSDVAGAGASAELGGLFFGSGDQHLDQSTVQVHSAPNTYSNLLYKGAVKDRAYSIYRGMIEAKPAAQKIDAYQNNNNLVLSNGARADSIPGLEIEANDLRCTHGATVGHLDPEQIFYLRSRGLSEVEARKMVIGGFFESVVERIPYEFVKEEVRRRIEGKIGA